MDTGHSLQNMLNARISDTQCFHLVTIKYNGRLIDMKHDAHEVNAKLSGRLGLGLAVKAEVLNRGAFLAALSCAHMKHGWQSPEAVLLCRAPTVKIRLWWSGMPCRGGEWILWASKALRCHTEIKWHNMETFKRLALTWFCPQCCRYQQVSVHSTVSYLSKSLFKHLSKWTDLQMCWALSSSSWLLSSLNFVLLTKFPPVVREENSGEMSALKFFSLYLSLQHI